MTQPIIRIGILDTPRTGPFIYDLIDEMEVVSEERIAIELIKIGATPMNFQPRYHILIDRLSHLVPFYRTYLKTALLNGCYVINNPFWFSADDKFFNCSLALQHKINLPKTLCLPSAKYLDGFQRNLDLLNIEHPLNWDEIIEHIGLPAVLKPYDGKGWKNVYFVNTKAELIKAYEASGELVMMLQEKIDYQHYVRCIALGKNHILPIEYIPDQHAYTARRQFLDPALETRILQDAQTIVSCLGYDMNTIEFAIRDGIPYAIDFMNPIPDFTPERIQTENYTWVIQHMVKVLIEISEKIIHGQLNPQDSFPPFLRGL